MSEHGDANEELDHQPRDRHVERISEPVDAAEHDDPEAASRGEFLSVGVDEEEQDDFQQWADRARFVLCAKPCRFPSREELDE